MCVCSVGGRGGTSLAGGKIRVRGRVGVGLGGGHQPTC